MTHSFVELGIVHKLDGSEDAGWLRVHTDDGMSADSLLKVKK